MISLQIKAVLKAVVDVVLWYNHNVVDVINKGMSYLVITSDATSDFLRGDDKDLLN